MDKYKNYIARTQQDRIMLDVLETLNEIKNKLTKEKPELIVKETKVVEKTPTAKPVTKEAKTVQTTSAAKNTRKPKGDK